MDLSIRMRAMYNVKHCYAIRLNFGDKLLSSLTKLVIEVKASICSVITNVKDEWQDECR